MYIAYTAEDTIDYMNTLIKDISNARDVLVASMNGESKEFDFDTKIYEGYHAYHAKDIINSIIELIAHSLIIALSDDKYISYYSHRRYSEIRNEIKGEEFFIIEAKDFIYHSIMDDFVGESGIWKSACWYVKTFGGNIDSSILPMKNIFTDVKELIDLEDNWNVPGRENELALKVRERIRHCNLQQMPIDIKINPKEG